WPDADGRFHPQNDGSVRPWGQCPSPLHYSPATAVAVALATAPVTLRTRAPSNQGHCVTDSSSPTGSGNPPAAARRDTAVAPAATFLPEAASAPGADHDADRYVAAFRRHGPGRWQYTPPWRRFAVPAGWPVARRSGFYHCGRRPESGEWPA